MPRKLFGLALLLSGCGDNGTTVITPTPPAASIAWTFQFSPGMSAPNTYGNGGFSFVFPATDGVHYLVKAQAGTLSSVIAITYTIDAPPSAVFDYRTNPDNTCGPGFPGTVTLYFHKANDPNWTDPFGRWFASKDRKELAPGAFTLAVLLSDPSRWQTASSGTGADNPAQFQSALASVAEVGLVFGGGCFAGHGVFVTGGTAAMAASSFGAN